MGFSEIYEPHNASSKLRDGGIACDGENAFLLRGGVEMEFAVGAADSVSAAFFADYQFVFFRTAASEFARGFLKVSMQGVRLIDACFRFQWFGFGLVG